MGKIDANYLDNILNLNRDHYIVLFENVLDNQEIYESE